MNILNINFKKLKLFLIRIFPLLLRGGQASVEALIVPLLMLVLSPWLLHTLGELGFGQWMLALSLNGFVHITSLGVGMAVMLETARINKEEANEEIGKIIKAGLLIAMLSGGVLIFISWFFSSYFVTLFFSKMGLPSIVENVLFFGVILLALQQFDEVLAGVLRGMQRFDLLAKMEICGRPIWAALIAFTAYHTADTVYLLYVHLIYTTLRILFRFFIVNNLFNENCLREKISIINLKKLIEIGKWVSVQSIGGIMFSTLDRLFVGGLFGAEGMVRYVICTQITQFVHNTQAAALQIITPWVAKKEKLNLLRISILTGLGCLVLPLTIMCGSWWLLHIWMGADFANNNSELLFLLMVGTTVLAFTIPAHFIVLGLGKVEVCAFVLLLGGFAALVGSLIGSAWGLLTFAAGRLLYGIVALGYFFVLRKLSL